MDKNMDNVSKAMVETSANIQMIVSAAEEMAATIGRLVSGKESATEILGLNRSTLRAKMRKLDISKP